MSEPVTTQPGYPPTIRIGDADRERLTDLLGAAFAQGYLSLADYESRLGLVYDAQDRGAAERILGDLPVRQIERSDPRRRVKAAAAARRGVRAHLGLYALMSLVCLTVWAAVALTADAWYFWPVWPILGGGIGVISHALPVQSCTRGWSRPRV